MVYKITNRGIENLQNQSLGNIDTSSTTIGSGEAWTTTTTVSTTSGNWDFSNGGSLSGLTAVGSTVDVSNGYAVFSWVDDNTHEYYEFTFDASNNTGDFIIDFEFKAQNQGGPDGNRAQIFDFGSLFAIYKAQNDYWRILGGSGMLKINANSLTPPQNTFGRFTFWYKYAENKWYMYYNGSAASLSIENSSGFSSVSGNSFIRGTSSQINASQNIRFGTFSQGHSTNTFDHMYFDIGGSYSESAISAGFTSSNTSSSSSNTTTTSSGLPNSASVNVNSKRFVVPIQFSTSNILSSNVSDPFILTINNTNINEYDSISVNIVENLNHYINAWAYDITNNSCKVALCLRLNSIPTGETLDMNVDGMANLQVNILT